VAVVHVLGVGLLLTGWVGSDIDPAAVAPTTVAFWLFMSLAAECFWLKTPTGNAMVSMSLAVNLATVFVLPLRYVLAIAALSVTASDLLLHRRSWLRATFNGSQSTIAMAAAFHAVRLIGGPHMGATDLFLLKPLAVVIAPLCFFIVNTSLVAGVMSLHSSRSLWRVWRENYGFGYQVLSTVTLSLLAVTLVLSIHAVGFISGLIFLLVFLALRESYQRHILERLLRQSGSASSS
jgi:hypothetical protein